MSLIVTDLLLLPTWTRLLPVLILSVRFWLLISQSMLVK
jgi:hypothetical protein